MSKNPQFLMDKEGRKVSVLIPIDEYELLLEAMEELEDIQAYDEAKKRNEPTVSLADALAEIDGKS